MGSPRVPKLADQIKVIVAQMLERRVKDPRLGFVTVTDVRLTGDARDATVFYTVLGSDTDQAGTAAALQSATGLIRSEVGKQLGLRFTPTVTFVADAVPENARQIDELLAQARSGMRWWPSGPPGPRMRARPIRTNRLRTRTAKTSPAEQRLGVVPSPGIVVVDKPAGWTSHQVVGRARRLLGTRKIGHAGTLDPMATGVLVLGVGRATRLLGHLSLTDKAYAATIRLGQRRSPTTPTAR